MRLRGVSKRFGEVQALQDVSLTARAGQVTALLGENGAGKSTLMQVLAGITIPDRGEILLDGKRVDLASPAAAIAHGVGMVHQHFQLVPGLSVAENILLGTDSPRWLLPRGAGHDAIRALAERSALAVDPAASVASLSVGEQQRVEILKVLWRGARVLILDEPTAVLSPLEVVPFFATVRALADAGAAVVLITHKLAEVRQVAERVTVLRRGRVVAGDLATVATGTAELERLILGGEALSRTDGDLAPAPLDRDGREQTPRLQLRAVEALGSRGEPALRGLSLDLKAGELLGLAGVSGNGQRELAEVVVGLRALQSGQIALDGHDLSGTSVRARLERGLAYVPEDRLGQGVAPSLSALQNLSLRAIWRAPQGRLLHWGDLRARAAALVERHDVRLRDLEQPAAQLSGGNVQKLILAREIASRPRLLVAAQPTRGLDLGAAADVRAALRELASQGCAVLLISEDLDELRLLCHRIAVLYRGRVVTVLEHAEASLEKLGRAMLGGEAAP